MNNIDALISGAVEDVERQDLIHRSSKRAQAVLGPAKVKRQPDWTEEEAKFLEENIAHLGHKRVGEILGRSALAIKVRRTRKGLKSPTRNDIYFTSNTAAHALNIDVHSVSALIRRGILKMEKAPVEMMDIRRIVREDLLAWAVDPMNWPYFLYTLGWKVRKIRDPKISRMITLRRQRWGDEWLSIGQVAKMYGVDSTDVNRVYIKMGRYRGRKVRYRNWCFLRSDVLQAGITFMRGKGQGHEHPKWTREAYKFFVLSLAVGMGNEATFGLMGGNVRFVEQQKLASLDGYGKLTPIAKELGVTVYRRAGEIRLFADWRMHKHRFPTIARAVSKFLAGRPLSRHDVLLVNRQLFFWGMRFARTPAQRKYVQRFRYVGSRHNPNRNPLRDRYAKLLSLGIDPFAPAPFEVQ